MSPPWSLFFNLVEFYPKQFRVSYVLITSFSSVRIPLMLLVFKVNDLQQQRNKLRHEAHWSKLVEGAS